MAITPNTESRTELVKEVSALTRPDEPSGMMSVQSAQAVAQIQGAMAIAKKFPRDESTALARIIRSCGRKSLAEVSIYEYPRGGSKVTGPSIRLAEALAQGWGNVDTGIVELERRSGESIAMAYCVDLETNYKKTMVFSVPHTRDSKQGKTNLKDDRDIYERVANDGSRRLRNCILAVIPGDVVDQALDACEKALKSDTVPLQDRIRAMVVNMSTYGVTKEMLEDQFGCKVGSFSEQQLVRIRGISQSLRDGIGTVPDFFKPGKEDTAGELAKKVDAKPVIKTDSKFSGTPDFDEFDGSLVK